MTSQPLRFLRLTRRFDASPERVFEAWVNPEIARKWLFAVAGERLVNQVGGQVGDQWMVSDRRGGMTYTAIGQYLEIEPPRRLVFNFGMPQFSPHYDRITIEIVPDGTGCVLTFTQEGVDIDRELNQLPDGVEGGSEQGWKLMFDLLETALNGSQ